MPVTDKSQQLTSDAVNAIFLRGRGSQMIHRRTTFFRFSQLTSLIKDRVDRREEEFRDDLDRTFQGNNGIVSAHVVCY